MSLELLNELFEDFGDDASAGEGSKFPIIQWENGENFAGWFVSLNNIPDGMTDDLPDQLRANDWIDDVFKNKEKQESPVLRIEKLDMVVMGPKGRNYRERWASYDDNDNRAYFYGPNAYDKAITNSAENGASSNIHMMVLIRNLEDVGPFLVTLRSSQAAAWKGGVNKPNALEDKGIISPMSFHRNVVRPAVMDQTGKSRISTNLFYTSVGVRYVGDKPHFIKVGEGKKSSVVILPEALSAEPYDIAAHLVSKDVGNIVRMHIAENAEWFTAWQSEEKAAAESATSSAPQTSPVVDMDDDDEPI